MSDIKFSIQAKDTDSLATFIKQIATVPSHTVITGTHCDLFIHDVGDVPSEQDIDYWKKLYANFNLDKLSVYLICGWKNECLWDSEWPDDRTD